MVLGVSLMFTNSVWRRSSVSVPYVDSDTVDMQLKSGPHPLYQFYSNHIFCPLQAVVYTVLLRCVRSGH
jgi:hypothetical protein